MRRNIRLGIYFVLILYVAIVSFVFVSSGPIMGHITATSNEDADIRDVLFSKGITFVDDEVTDEISGNDEVRVIIKLKEDIGDLNLNEYGFEKKQEFENFFSGKLRKSGLLNLIDSLEDEIESIQMDHEFFSMVDAVVPKISADLAWNSGFTGKDQTVCVIDTGIDYTHEELSGKYIGGYDFVNNDTDPMDDHGHGTYVSGIISSMAPGAKVIAVKALDKNGMGYESEIIAAIDYCIENRDAYDISVIVMALSGGSFEGYCDSVLVTKEANFASEQGIFVVAASGNGGGDNLTAPACGTKVTSVGAVTITDFIPCFTNINPLIDLLALGTYITSTKLGGGFGEMSGTSASTAVAAGAALLVLESEPLEPMELEYRFRATGFLIERDGTNYPRVDVYNAINNIVTNTPSEQVGEQSEGNWEEYGPAATCQCDGWECGPGSYCKDIECTPTMDNFIGECYSCLGDGSTCWEGIDDENCEHVECGDYVCEWE